MKFGVCSKDNLEYLGDIGYDYFEISLSHLSSLPDEEYEKYKNTILSTGLKAEAANLFLPAGFSIVDGTRSADEIRDYAEKAFSRFAAVGGAIAVLGSSGQRRIPDGLAYEEAYSRFVDAITIFCRVAEKYNITVAVEPLNTDETNLINTVAQAAELCQKVDLANFGCIADIYHIHKNNESISTIREFKNYIKHIHLSRRNNDRKMPFEASDIDDCKELAILLKEIGYNDRISLECGLVPNFEDGAKAMMRTFEIFK
ncbi:MAG: sugar phosphate isomerase/epimerase [Oscillospiraceae bacterium]|nr:sugar phosphate isomerase/epimerase [Oscillospiraceae bacterium]